MPLSSSMHPRLYISAESGLVRLKTQSTAMPIQLHPRTTMADPKNKLDYIQERMDTVVDRLADVGKTVEALKKDILHSTTQMSSMGAELKSFGSTLNNNTMSLQEHMHRTELLEDYVKTIDKRISPNELERLRKKAVSSWISAKLKFIAKLGAAVSAGGALLMAIKHLIERN